VDVDGAGPSPGWNALLDDELELEQRRESLVDPRGSSVLCEHSVADLLAPEPGGASTLERLEETVGVTRAGHSVDEPGRCLAIAPELERGLDVAELDPLRPLRERVEETEPERSVTS
jgi:hypothetical protein